MTRWRTHEDSLPVTGNLAPYYVLSIATAVLLTVASVAGLSAPDQVYPTRELTTAFFANDVVNLAVGLPILVAAMALTRRGSLVGLLWWPGALFFVGYTYIVYLYAMPPNAVFLLHLVLVALSVYTVAGLIAAIDAKAVRDGLDGGVPARFGGAVLAGLGLLFGLRAIGVVVGSWSGPALPRTEVGLLIADFLIATAWVTGGILLWRRRAFGYAAGLGLLFQGSMLFVGLIAFMILQPMVTGTSYPVGDIVAVLAMGLICFVPFGLFVRGAAAAVRLEVRS